MRFDMNIAGKLLAIKLIRVVHAKSIFRGTKYSFELSSLQIVYQAYEIE